MSLLTWLPSKRKAAPQMTGLHQALEEVVAAGKDDVGTIADANSQMPVFGSNNAFMTPNEEAKLDAFARIKASQITFYPYDRGQCFDKGECAILAFVNLPGACAHYCWSTATRSWDFVQIPHMCTEQRCAERMGYRSVEQMRKHLFDMFDGYLVSSGWEQGDEGGSQ